MQDTRGVESPLCHVAVTPEEYQTLLTVEIETERRTPHDHP
jgi:hypothetical protein